MTLAIALWGAALSTIIAVFQIHRFIRDRPEIHVDYSSGCPGPDHAPTLEIVATNRGHRPTTIVEAGFLIEASQELVDAVTEEGLKGHYPAFIVSGWRQTAMVGDGQQAPPFEATFAELPIPAHVDFPLRAYVEDGHGRTWWAEGQSFTPFRDWVGDYWPPPSTPDVKRRPLGELPGNLRPTRIVPRWRIWERHALRQGARFDVARWEGDWT